jgi:hypothetical protein
MKKSIYCKTVAKGVQAFYVAVGSKSYFLFNQKYYTGVRDYFSRGKRIDELSSACKHCNAAVRRTAAKLPVYLQYVEKEYGVVLYNKRENHKSRTHKSYKDIKSGRYDDVTSEYYDEYIA